MKLFTNKKYLNDILSQTLLIYQTKQAYRNLKAKSSRKKNKLLFNKFPFYQFHLFGVYS